MHDTALSWVFNPASTQKTINHVRTPLINLRRLCERSAVLKENLGIIPTQYEATAMWQGDRESVRGGEDFGGKVKAGISAFADQGAG